MIVSFSCSFESLIQIDVINILLDLLVYSSITVNFNELYHMGLSKYKQVTIYSDTTYQNI